jgi:MEMO1 family protein
VRRVVIAGPSHFWPVDGVAVSSATAFATPIGLAAVDEEARLQALGVRGVLIDDDAHAAEHSLEVQLPFVAAVFGDVPFLPLAVGRSGAAVLDDVLEVLWDGAATCVVISTDLSHYHCASKARRLDAHTAESICRLEAPTPDMACGAAAVAGMLMAARRHALDVELLDLRSSADTAGDPERVVGYGAFALYDTTEIAEVAV